MVSKKMRQHISYVLPLGNSSGGHRLGVNGLAVDTDNSILDGAIYAWKLNIDLNVSQKNTKLTPSTTFHSQVEAHTHWVNDIILAKNNSALISASSDLTVKVWRPISNCGEAPQTIGLHSDYVKCLATPRSQVEWVASGGLDRKLCIWDLNGAGKRLEIDVKDGEKSEKGSVYALATNRSILASGGPESVVRLWDPRSGKRITKLVGHTENIRDILITESGDVIMTASSDQTIKVWSVTACRCMYTLTMHNDSVWSLHSDDPNLCTFYSSDRSGLVVKTSSRGSLGEIHNGVSLAIAQENDGVNKVIASGNYIWTATSSSSINRWANIDTEDFQYSGAFSNHNSLVSEPLRVTNSDRVKQEISAQSILRITNTSSIPIAAQYVNGATNFLSVADTRKASIIVDPDVGVIVPVHAVPEETIQGQHGLIKHKLLNDRRRVLTLDTAGDILLWDLLQCIPIKSFGKRYLEEVEPEINTLEAVAPWCSINTHTGRLAVDLEENNCFDAEMYADELQLDDAIEFREDQRINLGKWILRHLFSNFIDEMLRRDEYFRKGISQKTSSDTLAPTVPQDSVLRVSEYLDNPDGNTEKVLVKTIISGEPRDELVLDNRGSQDSAEASDNNSYTSNSIEANLKPAASLSEIRGHESSPVSFNEKDQEVSNDGGTFFGKNFRKGMSLYSKKSLLVASTDKGADVDEKIFDVSEASESGEKEVEPDDCFRGVVRKIRMQYKKSLLENPQKELKSGITPVPPNETPPLNPPSLTTVIIQEQTTGGSIDLYKGTVASVGKDAHLIEQRAPSWLGELLLRNQILNESVVKVSFVLQPWQDLLPRIEGANGNSRLNANRMLRVKKILAYVAEHIEPSRAPSDPSTLKPEEYLELYCNDQKLPNTMTLATLRAHVWKGGADVILFYKSNGRKLIPLENNGEPSVDVSVKAGSNDI